MRAGELVVRHRHRQRRHVVRNGLRVAVREQALVDQTLAQRIVEFEAGSAVLRFTRRPESMFDYRIEDFEVTGYAPQAHISAPVAV